jgi:hypothetical protein
MKSAFLGLFIFVIGVPAIADQIIWSCNYDGNASALTITLLNPQTGSAGVQGHINDATLAGKLGIKDYGNIYGTASKAVDLEHSNLDLIYGENVDGFQFNHINGGIDVIPGWTDHVSPDYHTNNANHVFFDFGKCVYSPDSK